MPTLEVFDEWSPLKSVILGTAGEMFFHAPGALIPKETAPGWLAALEWLAGTLFQGRRVPGFIAARFAAELESLEKILKGAGAEVTRPSAVAPKPGEPPGLTQVFARDPMIAAGKRIIVGRQKLAALRKEIRGFENIVRRLRDGGSPVSDLTLGPPGAFLEGGDVLVDHPYLFVGVGPLATNPAGAAWLSGQVKGEFQVVTVPIVGPGIFHLDTCLTLTGPGRGIVCRSALFSPLPPPLNRYDLIEVDEKTRRQIGVNILMIDPETVVVQKRHGALQEALRQRGYRVLSLDFFWHALSGGGFRCATHPLLRAGAPP